jgi:hypothetical protein
LIASEIVLKIIKNVFSFCASIIVMLVVPFLALLLVAMIPALILLSLVVFLVLKFPILTNSTIILSLLFSGFSILSVLVIYLNLFAGIAIICAIILWISSMGESTSVEKEPGSQPKEGLTIDIESSIITETTISSNPIIVEDRNNIFCDNTETEYPSQIETVSSHPSIPFSQDREIIDYKVFKEHNLPRFYDFDNYEDDELSLKQEYIITSSVTKILEPS